MAKKVQPCPLAALFGQFCLPLTLMAVGVRLSWPLNFGWGNSNLLLKLMFPTVCVVVEVRSLGVGVGSAVQVPRIIFVRKSTKSKRHTRRVFIDIDTVNILKSQKMLQGVTCSQCPPGCS